MLIRELLAESNLVFEDPEIGDLFAVELDDTIIESVVVDLVEDGVVIQIDETALELLSSLGCQLDEQALDIQRIEAAHEEMLARSPQYAKEHAALGIVKMRGIVGAAAENNRNWTIKTAELLRKHGALKESNYTADEMVDILSGKKTQAQVDAEKKSKQTTQQSKPKVPEKPVKEAEYQGRTVPLGKPMKGDVKKSKVYVKGPKGNVVKVNFGDKKMKIKKSNPSRRKSFRARHNCANPGPRWKARYWSCRAW